LLNLLINAVKFTDFGDITVLIAPETENSPPSTLHFTVSDTGIGIPADSLPFIFEKFTQVSASPERKFGGTGLGLTISKRFVELMGGKIWAKSTIGVGTEMHFTARFAAESAMVVQSSDRPGLRCLVVDDNANHRGQSPRRRRCGVDKLGRRRH
jgi:signal transduction histidine kinase